MQAPAEAAEKWAEGEIFFDAGGLFRSTADPRIFSFIGPYPSISELCVDPFCLPTSPNVFSFSYLRCSPISRTLPEFPNEAPAAGVNGGNYEYSCLHQDQWFGCHTTLARKKTMTAAAKVTPTPTSTTAKPAATVVAALLSVPLAQWWHWPGEHLSMSGWATGSLFLSVRDRQASLFIYI